MKNNMCLHLVNIISEQWDKSIETRYGNSVDTERLQQVWDNLSADFDVKMDQNPSRADFMLELVRDNSLLPADGTVLDIGAGTGIYCMTLAPFCGRADALDFSQGMLNKLKEKSAAANINNIRLINASWEDFPAYEKNKSSEKYDLVISSLNPSISNAEGLKKMNNSSRGHCVYIAACESTSKAENNIKEGIEEFLGIETAKSCGNDAIFPFNLLYFWGLNPRIEYLTFSWEHKYTPQKAWGFCEENYLRYGKMTDEVEQKIRDYIESHTVNGEYIEESLSTMAFVYWRARHLD